MTLVCEWPKDPTRFQIRHRLAVRSRTSDLASLGLGFFIRKTGKIIPVLPSRE